MAISDFIFDAAEVAIGLTVFEGGKALLGRRRRRIEEEVEEVEVEVEQEEEE